MKPFFNILLMWLSVWTVSAQNTFSILGDSYSTFFGYVTPETNRCFYREVSSLPNDVHDVQKTWWWMWGKETGCKMLVNNSFSASTICNSGYENNDYSDRSFVTRKNNIGNPDILFIFGGTNDCWAHAPIGDFKYSDWTKDDLYKFRPAFACMLDYYKREHPNMRIINICNCDLYGEYNASMATICEYYGVECLMLENVDKQHDHPSIMGMRQIVEQIKAFMNKSK